MLPEYEALIGLKKLAHICLYSKHSNIHLEECTILKESGGVG